MLSKYVLHLYDILYDDCIPCISAMFERRPRIVFQPRVLNTWELQQEASIEGLIAKMNFKVI
jgi:hypothetical protein